MMSVFEDWRGAAAEQETEGLDQRYVERLIQIRKLPADAFLRVLELLLVSFVGLEVSESSSEVPEFFAAPPRNFLVVIVLSPSFDDPSLCFDVLAFVAAVVPNVAMGMRLLVFEREMEPLLWKV